MKTVLGLAVAFIGGVGLIGSAAAADLEAVGVATSGGAASAWGAFYLQVFGGATLPGAVDIEGGGVWDTAPGWAWGAALGVETPLPGVAVELDYYSTHAEIDGVGYDAETASLMANVVYTADLNDTFGVYGGAGLGIIRANDDDGAGNSTFDDVHAGYQLKAGIIARVTPNVGVVAEYRWQDSFGRFDNDASAFNPISYPTSAVLAGLRLSMD